MFKLSLVAATVVIIKSTTRRLSSKDEMNSVDGIYKGFQFGRGRRGELLGLVKFELATKETKYYDIFTGKPKSSFPHIESKNDIQ